MSRRRFVARFTSLCGIAALCLLCLPAFAAAEPALPTGFQDELVFGNLEQPTNFRFAADGGVFVAEKPGKIMVYDSLGDPTPEVFADLRTDVYDNGDRGLLGIALDPEFTTGRPYVYALYTYDHILGDAGAPPKWGTANTTGDPCPELNGGDACLVSGRLVRLTAEGNHAKLSSGGEPEQKVLVEGWCQQFSSHSIGDLHFGPEGALYVSGGDGASFSNADYGQFGTTTPNPCGDPPGGKGVALTPPTAEGGALRSQNMGLLNGKILRVDPDTGEGLITNPIGTSLDQNSRRIVAAGFRNPFRFTFDPQTGDLYTGNVGSSEIEEVDRFETPPASVYNSGWPCYEGIERQFQYRELGLNVCKALYADEPGSTSLPFFNYSHGQSVVPEDECGIEYGSAIGGVSFYEAGPGADFPAKYDGAFFFADAVRGCVWVMYPGEDGRPDPTTTERFMRESHVYPAVYLEQGPDGDLYYASLSGDENGAPGAIHRITYNPGAPTARLTATPPYGVNLPLNVTFDAAGSSDPDGESLQYDWDMDGDGVFELENAGPTQSKSFTKAEQDKLKSEEKSLNPVVAVRVTDGEGLSSVAKVTVYPGDSPPQVQITKPLPSFEWTVGEELKLDGSAKTADGAEVVTPLPYYWTTKLAHCPTGPTTCHEHPLQTFAGIRRPEFLAPEHDYPSYIKIDLRVADERGLTGEATLNIYPKTAELEIESSPPGIELTAGLKQDLAPFTLTTIRGSTVLLGAPETAELDGKTYTWKSWSDDGARSHNVLATADANVKAIYTTPEPELFQLTVAKAGTGSGIVTSSPAGIDCGSACDANFADGAMVTLGQVPGVGSVFKGWTGACTGTGTCEVTMSAAKSVGAEFDPIPSPKVLKVTKAGSGSGTVTSFPAGLDCGPTCEFSFDEGEAVTLSAAPGATSKAVVWSGCDLLLSNECKVTMTAAKAVTATFDVTPSTPPTETPPASIPPASLSPPPPASTPPPVSKGLTVAQALKKALKKCAKLRGRAKAKCIKKAKARAKAAKRGRLEPQHLRWWR